MKNFPEVNWSALVRKTIMEKTNELSLKETMLNELKKEENFSQWAVNLIRKGRKDDEIILKKSLPEDAILSEKSFARIWLNKEEDEAWKDL